MRVRVRVHGLQTKPPFMTFFFLHYITVHSEALVLFLFHFLRRNMFSMTTVEAVIASCSHTGPRIYRHIFMLCVCVCVRE